MTTTTTIIKLSEESYSFFENLKRKWKLDNFDQVISRVAEQLEEDFTRDERRSSFENKKKLIEQWEKMLKNGNGLDTKSKLYQDYIQSIEEIKKDKTLMKEEMEWEALGADDGID